MKQLTLVKLGGSVITDKNTPYTPKKDTIQRLADELKYAKNQLIISHGSGSFGHTPAKIYGGKKGYKNKWGFSKIAFDAAEINRIVMNEFIQKKLSTISVRPLGMLLAKTGYLDEHFFDVVGYLIEQKLTPVVFGDVILDKVWKSTIFSGEVVLHLLANYFIAKGFHIQKIIMVVDTNGFLDDNGKTVKVITKDIWRKLTPQIRSQQNDVTGGIQHKIESALLMASYGVNTLLVNGNSPDELKNILQGKKACGTLITGV